MVLRQKLKGIGEIPKINNLTSLEKPNAFGNETLRDEVKERSKF